MGSSSSGSNSAPLGFVEGGKARNRLTLNITTICLLGRKEENECIKEIGDQRGVAQTKRTDTP